MFTLPAIPNGLDPPLSRAHRDASNMLCQLQVLTSDDVNLRRRVEPLIVDLRAACRRYHSTARLYRAKAVRAGITQRYRVMLEILAACKTETQATLFALREQQLKEATALFEAESARFHAEIRPLLELDVRRFTLALEAFIREAHAAVVSSRPTQSLAG